MAEDNKFFESLKVDSSTLDRKPVSRSTDRDVYTCTRLMYDTSKVKNFLSITQRDVGENNLSITSSFNYYWSVNHLLGEASYDLENGKIGHDEFNRRIDEACSGHRVDFDYLIETVNRIDDLKEQPNQEEAIKLVEELEDRARNYRKNKDGMDISD